MALLDPDRCFSRVSRISIERDLRACGLANVLLDVDNTVRSRADGCVPRDVREWLVKAARAGIGLCLVSNNSHAGPLNELSRDLGIPVVGKAFKPLPGGFLRARGMLGAHSADTVVVGDQLSTDVAGAHLLGMKAYYVAPLVEEDLRHTMLLRRFERAYLKRHRTPAPEPVPAPVASCHPCERGIR